MAIMEGVSAGELENAIMALMRCLKIPNHELATKLIVKLVDVGEIPAASLAGELDVSYPLVIRVLSELERVGIIESGKLKGKGRGRPKKLIKLNKDKLGDLLRTCEESLRILRVKIIGEEIEPCKPE